MEKIKIGVFGAGRGVDLAKSFMLLGCEIVALCEDKDFRSEGVAKQIGDAKIYTDFDEFVQHDMDAVILANYFHEHAPYAIKCFERNLHVFSECISNGTMAEGVELVRAFKKSKSIYMIAENYPQMLFNREMRRVCKSGALGTVMFAEGEYNHPADPKDTSFLKRYNYDPMHWRNFAPRTYYITHSLGPVMSSTGATPRRVSAQYCYAPPPREYPTASHVGDKAAIIMTQNDDGSVFRVTGCAAFGGHENSYRICGTKGQIENLRGMGNKVMLRYNEWEKPEGEEATQCYEPSWNDPDEELIKSSGHGGGDYLTARAFVECIREGKQPEHPFDIYSATVMSSVAILGHRSALENGKLYDIPDFRKEEDCKQYENDRLTPFYGPDGSEPTLPCYSHSDYAPTEKQLEMYKELIK
ncbi:MAG: Gfo/Idh/MocA family oxidoreductase [Clostridia bacterium]|nr:Gfo/Idh/MocA family oxidoreductase [Clostridia bacterium]